jgi:hypothetical protein
MISAFDSKETPWESSKNDQIYKVSQQQQEQQHEQSSGEAPHETAAATTATLNWHEEVSNGNNNVNNVTLSSDMDMRYSGDSDRHRHHHHHHHGRNQHHSRPHPLCLCPKICSNLSFQHILYSLDISILSVYVAYTVHYHYDKNNNADPQQIAVLLISTGITILIVLRGLLLVLSWFLFPSKRCSKIYVRNFTLILFACYTVLAVTAWIVMNTHGNNPLPWCQGLGKWCASSPMKIVVPTSFTILAVMEVFRFLLAQGQLNQDHIQPSEATTTTTSHYHDHHQRGVHRPWWWNRRHNNPDDDDNSVMRESLLFGSSNNNGQPGWSAMGGQSYLMEDGVGTPPPSRSLLGRWLGMEGGNESNPRDDGSVDYASLNEEWASRTEEDPYWWTREENNRHNNNTALDQQP